MMNGAVVSDQNTAEAGTEAVPLSTKADFEAATGVVSGLNFKEVDLRGTEAPTDVIFSNCDFSRAKFANVNLSGLVFKGCLFQQTDFSGSILLGAAFSEKCNLTGAILKGVDASNASFVDCNMSRAIATGAEFVEINFKDTKMERAVFDRSDLSNAKDFEPDCTQVDGTVFTGKSVDSWTYLRGEYTGLNLVVAIIPVLIFVISLLGKAYLKVAVSAYATYANPEAVCDVSGNLCEKVPLWEIMLGLRDGTMATVFIVFSIVYNVARYLVTKRVSALAETEDRTHTTPRQEGLGGYLLLRRVSYFVWWAKWGMLILFGYNMIELLSHPILLPK